MSNPTKAVNDTITDQDIYIAEPENVVLGGTSCKPSSPKFKASSRKPKALQTNVKETAEYELERQYDLTPLGQGQNQRGAPRYSIDPWEANNISKEGRDTSSQ